MKGIVQRLKRQGKKGCICSKGLFIPYNSSTQKELSERHQQLVRMNEIFGPCIKESTAIENRKLVCHK